MGFRGGKGLAAFGGMVLAFDPKGFVAILIPRSDPDGDFQHRCGMPITVGILFPLILWLRSSTPEILHGAIAGLLIMFMHRDNLRKAITNKVCDKRHRAMEALPGADRELIKALYFDDKEIKIQEKRTNFMWLKRIRESSTQRITMRCRSYIGWPCQR